MLRKSLIKSIVFSLVLAILNCSTCFSSEKTPPLNEARINGSKKDQAQFLKFFSIQQKKKKKKIKNKNRKNQQEIIATGLALTAFSLFLYIQLKEQVKASVTVPVAKPHTPHKPHPKVASIKSYESMPRHKSPSSFKREKRWKVFESSYLSLQVKSVLNSAFGEEYDNSNHYLNAYNFQKENGAKGMDWWNFPWDLPSSKSKYQITYDDMKDLITYVDVQNKKNDPSCFVPYAQILESMILQLNSTIMNSHGGALRVIKIIYCIRNFLKVAIKYSHEEARCQAAISPLKNAAQKILEIANAGDLLQDQNPYIRNSRYQPKDINGNDEDRNYQNGIAELQFLLTQ